MDRLPIAPGSPHPQVESARAVRTRRCQGIAAGVETSDFRRRSLDRRRRVAAESTTPQSIAKVMCAVLSLACGAGGWKAVNPKLEKTRRNAGLELKGSFKGSFKGSL